MAHFIGLTILTFTTTTLIMLTVYLAQLVRKERKSAKRKKSAKEKANARD